MDEKQKGFYQKYKVIKMGNPGKEMDCIVLEFDDPIARKGIQAWAEAMNQAGYHRCAAGVAAKLINIEHPGTIV